MILKWHSTCHFKREVQEAKELTDIPENFIASAV